MRILRIICSQYYAEYVTRIFHEDNTRIKSMSANTCLRIATPTRQTLTGHSRRRSVGPGPSSMSVTRNCPRIVCLTDDLQDLRVQLCVPCAVRMTQAGKYGSVHSCMIPMCHNVLLTVCIGQWQGSRPYKWPGLTSPAVLGDAYAHSISSWIDIVCSQRQHVAVGGPW